REEPAESLPKRGRNAGRSPAVPQWAAGARDPGLARTGDRADGRAGSDDPYAADDPPDPAAAGQAEAVGVGVGRAERPRGPGGDRAGQRRDLRDEPAEGAA